MKAGKADIGLEKLMQHFNFLPNGGLKNYKPEETERSAKLLEVLKGRTDLAKSLHVAKASNAMNKTRQAESRLYDKWTDSFNKVEYKKDPTTKRVRAELRPEAATALRFLRKFGGFNYAYPPAEDLVEGRESFDWLGAHVRLFLEVVSGEIDHYLTEYDKTLQVAEKVMENKKQELHKGKILKDYVVAIRKGKTEVRSELSKELRKLTKEMHAQAYAAEVKDDQRLRLQISKMKRDVDLRDDNIEMLYRAKKAVTSEFATAGMAWKTLSEKTSGQEVRIDADDRTRLIEYLQTYIDDPGKRQDLRAKLIGELRTILVNYSSKVKAFIDVVEGKRNSVGPSRPNTASNSRNANVGPAPREAASSVLDVGLDVEELRQHLADAQSSGDPQLATAAREAAVALPTTPQQTEALVEIQQTIEANAGQNRSGVNQLLEREAGRRGISKAGLLYLLATIGVLSTGAYYALPAGSQVTRQPVTAVRNQPSSQLARIFGRSYDVNSAGPSTYPRPDITVRNNIRPGVMSDSYWSVPQVAGAGVGAAALAGAGLAGAYGVTRLLQGQAEEENKRELQGQASQRRNIERRQAVGMRSTRSQNAVTRSRRSYRPL